MQTRGKLLDYAFAPGLVGITPLRDFGDRAPAADATSRRMIDPAYGDARRFSHDLS
jgi:hypothetical protein